MDMGIRGRTALVCGASRGLGRACARALALEGVHVTMVARGNDALQRAAAEVGAESGTPVAAIACDITTPEGRAAALAALPAPDILVTNAGARRPAISAPGSASTGWRRSTPTCSRRSS